MALAVFDHSVILIPNEILSPLVLEHGFDDQLIIGSIQERIRDSNAAFNTAPKEAGDASCPPTQIPRLGAAHRDPIMLLTLDIGSKGGIEKPCILAVFAGPEPMEADVEAGQGAVVLSLTMLLEFTRWPCARRPAIHDKSPGDGALLGPGDWPVIPDGKSQGIYSPSLNLRENCITAFPTAGINS